MTAMKTGYMLHFARQILRTIAVLAGLAVVSTQPLLATPPFGHSDQPYPSRRRFFRASSAGLRSGALELDDLLLTLVHETADGGQQDVRAVK